MDPSGTPGQMGMGRFATPNGGGVNIDTGATGRAKPGGGANVAIDGRAVAGSISGPGTGEAGGAATGRTGDSGDAGGVGAASGCVGASSIGNDEEVLGRDVFRPRR